MSNEKCPNCGAEIRNGFVKTNTLVTAFRKKMINRLLENNKEGYCDACAPDLEEKISELKSKHQKFFDENIDKVPVITTHSPYSWKYVSLGIVTGQSVTGTGVVSELKSGFSDFFGTQSNSFINKIASGESICLAQLRVKALNLGGHAVIATDIDYGELGNLKGMIMVCASGTAVQLIELDPLGDIIEIISKLKESSAFLTKCAEE